MPHGPECDWAERTVLLALHALEPDEVEAVDRHVRSCAACRATLDEAQETFAAVGETAATAPPPRLRGRVLAATDQRVAVLRPARPDGDRRRWLTAAAAAVLVAGLAGGGIAVAQLDRQRAAATSHAGTVEDLLATIARSPHAVLVDRDRRPIAAVALGDAPRFYDLALPAPAPGKAWVLWGMRGRAATALATVPGPAVAVGRPGQFEAYVLTQEAKGPLPASHGDPVAAGPVVGPGA